jgi:hypothetical protein
MRNVLMALAGLGYPRSQPASDPMEDDLRTITDVPMERAVAIGWKGWI